MKKLEISEEKLRELYLEKYYSQSMCAEYFNTSVSSIRRKLAEYNIKQSKEMISKKKSLAQTLDVNLTKEELIDMYINKNMSSKEMCEALNVSRSYLMRLLRSYDIRKPKSLEIENRSKTMLERYGVKYSFQSEELKEKSRKTLREKYGVDYISQARNIKEKVKKTNLEKYGVENVWSKNSPVLEKVKQTNLDRYGAENPWGSKVIQDKIKETNLERFGVEYPLQSEEVVNIMRKNNLEKYGVENVLQLESIKEKSRQTNLERYGVEYYCMTEDCISKNKVHRISKVNEEFYNKLLENNIECELEYYIGTKGFDIKSNNILIEINPSYTHNSTYGALFKGKTTESPKDYDYHILKTKLANDNGFQCIHIFDWDDEDKIINMLKPKENVYARKCDIREVELKDTNIFLTKYHLQGYCSGQTIRLGLYYNNELVEIMTFGKPRYNKNYEYELLRLCTKAEYNVIGGSSKIFKYFIDNYSPNSIISYCDISKFSGEVYNKLGFTLKSNSKPAKHWYNMHTGKHITDNLLRQRGYDQLFGTDYGKGTSNEQLMLENGFVEVYDCGQSTYIWNKEV